MTGEFKDLPEVRAKLKPTAIFVRHGSTKYDLPGDRNMIQGWMPGGLSKKGVAEAQAIGRTLRNFPIRVLYTSNLDRAEETAEVIASYHRGLKVKPTGILRCWHMGILEGTAKTLEIRKAIDILQNAWPGRKIHRGESFNQFKARVLPAIKSILVEASESPEEGFVVAVVHSDVIRVIHAWVAAGSHGDLLDKNTLSEALQKTHVDPAEGVVLTPYRESYKISRLKGTR